MVKRKKNNAFFLFQSVLNLLQCYFCLFSVFFSCKACWDLSSPTRDQGPPWWLSDKESACSAGDARHWFNPWVGKIPGRRKWQPVPVLLPGKSHGQRSLVGCSPWGRQSQTRLSDNHHYHQKSNQHHQRWKAQPWLLDHQGSSLFFKVNSVPRSMIHIFNLMFSLSHGYWH